MKKEKAVNRAARALAEARWAGVSEKDRKDYAVRIAKMPRSEKRCFCGATGMINAANRYFDCCRRAGVITLNLERKREIRNEANGRNDSAAQ